MKPSLEARLILAKGEFCAGNAERGFAATAEAVKLAEELGPEAGTYTLIDILSTYMFNVRGNLAVAVHRQGVLSRRDAPFRPTTEMRMAALRVHALLPKLEAWKVPGVAESFQMEVGRVDPGLVYLRPDWVDRARTCAAEERGMDVDLGAHIAAQKMVDQTEAALRDDLRWQHELRAAAVLIKAQLSSPYVDLSGPADILFMLRKGMEAPADTARDETSVHFSLLCAVSSVALCAPSSAPEAGDRPGWCLLCEEELGSSWRSLLALLEITDNGDRIASVPGLGRALQILRAEVTFDELRAFCLQALPGVALEGTAGFTEDRQKEFPVPRLFEVAYRACREVPSARSFANLGRVLAEGLQWGPLSTAAARSLELAKREGSAAYQLECAALGFLAARNGAKFFWEEVRDWGGGCGAGVSMESSLPFPF